MCCRISTGTSHSVKMQRRSATKRSMQRTLALMEKVADWQLAHLEPVASIKVMREETRSPRSWQQGAFYAGLTALAERSKSTRFRDAVLAHGRSTAGSWAIARYHADDHVIGQSYLWAATHGAGQEAIAPVAQTLRRDPRGSSARQSCRACSRSSAGTAGAGAMPCSWRRRCGSGWRRRPATSAMPSTRTPSSRQPETTSTTVRSISSIGTAASSSSATATAGKLFWSRGNGWVFAGIARVLERLPASDPARPMYEELFKEMAAKLKAVQKPDGYWAPSLLAAPEGTPPESSGTGFFVYGMAWGIAAGLLDRAEYEPAVRRGWRALERAVHLGRHAWLGPASQRSSRTSCAERYAVLRRRRIPARRLRCSRSV